MISFFFLVFLCLPIHYSQIYVSPNSNHTTSDGSLALPFPDLNSALNATTSQIILLDGIYYVQNLTISQRSLTITSLNGATKTIIDGGSNSGCLNLVSGTFTFDGLTIQNCVKFNDSTTNVSSVNSGAGIWIESSHVNLSNLIISGNNADFVGGGIALYSGSLSLYNCTIQNNTAVFGGGIYLKSAYILLSNNSLVQSNCGKSLGGGIHIENGTTEAENSSRVQNNILGTNGVKNQGYCSFGNIVFSSSASTDLGYECHSCTIQDQNPGGQNNLCGPAPNNNHNPKLRFFGMSVLVLVVGMFL